MSEEHLVFDKDGKMAGLWDIDSYSVNGVDLWDKLDQIVGAYVKVHPIEMEILVRENKAISQSRMDNHQIVKKGGSMLRWGASLPPALMFKLEQVEPMLFSNKKLFHKFLNKYKGFRICKSV